MAPAGPPAAQYAASVDHPLTGPEQTIAQALADLPLELSPALSRMTRELARTAPDRANIPPLLVDGLMAWAGLVHPPPKLLIVEIPDASAGCHLEMSPRCRGALASLVEQVRTSVPTGESLLYGVGVSAVEGRNATRMIVSLLESAVELEPFPASVAPGRSVELRGRLTGGRVRPSVEIIDPRGGWTTAPSTVSLDGTFSTTVTCTDVRGPHQVEILAEGQHGPEVAANFPLFCGLRAPKQMVVEIEQIDPEVTPERIAQANFHYLNQERQRRGLPPLVWDDGAAEVAEAHSRDMQQSGFVGHRSPTTGEVSDRFARSGVKGTVIRENVARGYGPKGIHESLMRSPGHRVNILATDITHVGIGVVVGPPETDVSSAPRPVFATQNFFRPPGAGAPPDARLTPVLKEKVDESRRASGQRPVQWSPALERTAKLLAQAYARAREPAGGWEEPLYRAGYNAVQSHQAKSGDFEALTGIDLWSSPTLEAGVAVVRIGEGDATRFLMVVLVGERR